jgi:hypothetical protein
MRPTCWSLTTKLERGAFAVALAALFACNNDGRCKTAYAIKVDGVCDCPAGTVFVSRDDACLGPDGGAPVSGEVSPEAGGHRDSGSDATGLRDAMQASADAPDAADGEPNDADGDGGGPGATPAGTPCEVAGAVRCGSPGTPLRQRCEQGTWMESQPCSEGELCDPNAPPETACVPAARACMGRGAGPACDDTIMHICEEGGVSRETKACGSAQQCQLGLTKGECAPCVPGTFRCTGAKLEACAADGQGYVLEETCASASLCKAEAGACTSGACEAGSKTCAGKFLRACNADLTAFEDEKTCTFACDPAGKQCDVCTANARECTGNRIKVCSADGQTLEDEACPSAKPFCVGAGECAQCKVASDCPTPTNDCQVATCANGTCGTAPKTAGQACAGGVCTAAGRCVECTQKAHCTEGYAIICDTGTNSCVQCISTADCDTGKVCENGACIAGCGNGRLDSGEECDPKAPGMDTFRCSPDCKSRRILTSCRTEGDCDPNSMCRTCSTGPCVPGICVPRSEKLDGSDCPVLDGYQFVNASLVPVCVVACDPNSASSTQCPVRTPNCVLNQSPQATASGFCD